MTAQIAASLAAESVGLPPVWLDIDEGVCRLYGKGLDNGRLHPIEDALPLDLSDPQTAFGLALKLDEWERFHRESHKETPFGDADLNKGYEGKRWAWSVELNAHQPEWTARGRSALEALAARITHIAHDHAIRRALRWTVEPGTLATLERGRGGWVLSSPNRTIRAAWEPGAYPHIADITDPGEALAAIRAEVAP